MQSDSRGAQASGHGTTVVHAATELLLDRTRVLKHDETFAVFDRHGDIRPFDVGSHGIYHRGTRYVSTIRLTLYGSRPALLGSTVTGDNTLLTVDLANHDIVREDRIVVPADTIHISRSKVLWEGACYEAVKVVNYGQTPQRVPIEIDIDADFADIFEVRGQARPRTGRRHPPQPESDGLTLVYEGLDDVERRMKVACDPVPSSIEQGRLSFVADLSPGRPWVLSLVFGCEHDEEQRRARIGYARALARARETVKARASSRCRLFTANEQFDDWLNRSLFDLDMLTTETPRGPYPYAGIPWFSTAFGRDGILTALESLWVSPGLARGVLGYLAERQATAKRTQEDAEPGKILHETRDGEMAALGEVPFGRYYGSADATPLFVVLAGAYYERTGDRATLELVWPAVKRALAWLEEFGDIDGDGFIEYARHADRGLVHQGWKDSDDSVFHADGAPARGPIALCEVQAYAYAARVAASKLALVLGESAFAVELSERATALRDAFEQRFWSDALGTYVLALDGGNRQCHVRTSNAGHALFAGIAGPDRARDVARGLLSEPMFSGWGVRTVAADEARYNPMSYHNGSVWPHDNAIVAAGLGRYGFRAEALAILSALFDASLHMDLRRMPELFCGFARRADQGPTNYPVACAPQAWAAAAVLSLLQTVLGLTLDGPARRITFKQPQLPPWLEWVRLENLELGGAAVDLLLRRAEHDVAIEISAKRGDVEVTVAKTI